MTSVKSPSVILISRLVTRSSQTTITGISRSSSLVSSPTTDSIRVSKPDGMTRPPSRGSVKLNNVDKSADRSSSMIWEGVRPAA